MSVKELCSYLMGKENRKYKISYIVKINNIFPNLAFLKFRKMT
jgi:hypothetical protein